jgi:hypothetical protein
MLFVTLLLFSALLTVLPTTTFAIPDPTVPTGLIALFDAVDGDNNVTWVVGMEPGSAPYFDVVVRVSNLTDTFGVACSLVWNSSVLNLTSWSWATTFDATGKITLPLDFDVSTPGKAKQGGIGHLSPDSGSVITIPMGVWADVVTLTFEFIGSTPTLVTPPIDEVIQIVNATSEESYWFVYPSQNAIYYFAMGGCGFFYEAVPIPPYSPTAAFTVLEAAPYYPGDVLTFDASSSTGGWDGDELVPIVQYNWTFGDSTSASTASPTITHNYSLAGPNTVCLTVYAPGVGPFIDPSYGTSVPDTDSTCDTVLVIPKLDVGIDVYTELHRDPCYNTSFTGEGINETADAFRPQEKVTLFASVVYKGSPRQNKPVSWVITGPGGEIEFKMSSVTGDDDCGPLNNGIANITFTIPWTCNDTYNDLYIYGEWTVVVSVLLPDPECGEEITYTDTLTFEVCDILVVQWIIDGYQTRAFYELDVWKQCWDMEFQLNVTNCALEVREGIIGITLFDDVMMPIGALQFAMNFTPGENVFSTGDIHIPKWAYPGENARVVADVYLFDCETGGVGAPYGGGAAVHSVLLSADPEWTDEALAYPWGPVDDYCILQELPVLPFSPGPNVATRLYPGYLRDILVQAMLSDGIVHVIDIRNKIVDRIHYYYNRDIGPMTMDEARTYLAIGEQTCGWVDAWTLTYLP